MNSSGTTICLPYGDAFRQARTHMFAPEHSYSCFTALRRWLPWLALAGGLLALSFFADASIDRWFDRPHPKPLRHVACFISYLGDWPALVIGAAAAGLLGLAVRRCCWRIVFLMVLAASLAGVTSNVSRCLTGRARPHAAVAQGWYGPPIGRKQRLAKHAINSFPSAHTTTATAFFVALLILAPEIGWWLMPAPFLVGASRLYLGVHHFSDVCAGLLLGAAFAIFTCRVFDPHWTDIRKWLASRLPQKSRVVAKAIRLPSQG